LIRGLKFSIVILIARLIIGGLFLYAAYHKLKPGETALDDPTLKFLFSVEAFKILPHQLVEPAAWTIPWLEVIAAAMIVLGLWTRSAALALTALIGSFIYVIRISLDSGNVDMDCGCFGGAALFCPKTGLTECHFWQDVGFAAFTVFLLITGGGRFSLDALFFRPDARDDDDHDHVDGDHRPVTREIEGRPAGL